MLGNVGLLEAKLLSYALLVWNACGFACHTQAGLDGDPARQRAGTAQEDERHIVAGQTACSSARELCPGLNDPLLTIGERCIGLIQLGPDFGFNACQKLLIRYRQIGSGTCAFFVHLANALKERRCDDPLKLDIAACVVLNSPK